MEKVNPYLEKFYKKRNCCDYW